MFHFAQTSLGKKVWIHHFFPAPTRADCVHLPWLGKQLRRREILNLNKLYCCYGDISYHTPKMNSSNLNIFSELARSGKTFDRQTANRERLVLLLYDFLFSTNTITFTYHPLFELFFHRSYLKTTTIVLKNDLVSHPARGRMVGRRHTIQVLNSGENYEFDDFFYRISTKIRIQCVEMFLFGFEILGTFWKSRSCNVYRRRK